MLILNSVRTEFIRIAKNVAMAAHEKQKYGNFPYSIHLQAVESVALRFGIQDIRILAACWLHDVLEDTKWTEQGLMLFFGDKETIEIVKAITEPKEGTRKERHTVTYPKIKDSIKCVIVKLCDRIANVEAGGKTDMYLKEHDEFRSYFYEMDVGEFQESYDLMCNYLDSLLIK